jgi:hypothetical protein
VEPFVLAWFPVLALTPPNFFQSSEGVFRFGGTNKKRRKIIPDERRKESVL